MDLQTAKNDESCPRAEIAVYLDGEFSPAAELAFERHVAVCKSCLAELNLQKKMLSALNFAFDDRAEIEIPKNFAKIVAATAESGVSGLRSKDERFRALFLCAVLFLIVLAGLGAETEKVFAAFGVFAEQTAVVAGFVFHSVYNFALGLCVVTRSLSQQIIFGSSFSVSIIIGLFLVSFVALSHLVIRYNRQ